MQAGGYDSLVELRAQEGALSAEDQARKDDLEAYYDMKLDVFRRLLSDGMLPRLVISTDAGPFDCEFGHVHYGLRLAVEAGMSNAQALEAATRIAAQACGVAPLVGTLEPGKEADLLVVRGNPLEDIEALTRVAAVYAGGKQVVRTPD
jgi:imidazolonepropionase-like amidohydrolase